MVCVFPVDILAVGFVAASCSVLGCIWMILRDLVGGGGKAKSSFVITGPVFCLLRGASREVGDAGLYDESEPVPEDAVELVLARSCSW